MSSFDVSCVFLAFSLIFEHRKAKAIESTPPLTAMPKIGCTRVLDVLGHIVLKVWANEASCLANGFLTIAYT